MWDRTGSPCWGLCCSCSSTQENKYYSQQNILLDVAHAGKPHWVEDIPGIFLGRKFRFSQGTEAYFCIQAASELWAEARRRLMEIWLQSALLPQQTAENADCREMGLGEHFQQAAKAGLRGTLGFGSFSWVFMSSSALNLLLPPCTAAPRRNRGLFIFASLLHLRAFTAVICQNQFGEVRSD